MPVIALVYAQRASGSQERACCYCSNSNGSWFACSTCPLLHDQDRLYFFMSHSCMGITRHVHSILAACKPEPAESICFARCVLYGFSHPHVLNMSTLPEKWAQSSMDCTITQGQLRYIRYSHGGGSGFASHCHQPSTIHAATRSYGAIHRSHHL